MPPYSKNVSKAQQRMMFYLASKGKVSEEDAEGRARATKDSYSKPPEHVREPKRKKYKMPPRKM
jgi:hypothetical protein